MNTREFIVFRVQKILNGCPSFNPWQGSIAAPGGVKGRPDNLTLILVLVFCHLLFIPNLYSAAPNQTAIPPKINLPERNKPWALLILPVNEQKWLEVLEKFPKLRFTVALDHEDISKFSLPLQTRLLQLKKEGRLEVALRLSGDPPLPLIYDLDLAKIFLPHDLPLPSTRIAWEIDVTGQIVRGKMNLKLFLGDFPKGFVPGGGALSLPVAEFLKKQKFAWSIGSFPEKEWTTGTALSMNNGDDPLLIFQAHPLSNLLHNNENTQKEELPEIVKKFRKSLQSDTPNDVIPVVVYDEEHASFSLMDFLTEYKNQNTFFGNPNMILCSAAAQAYDAHQRVSSSQVWPYSWSWLKGEGSPAGPGLTVWIGDPQKNLAWDLLSQTRMEIEKYQNSGQAVLEKLDRTMEEFYRAESGKFFEHFGNQSSENLKHNSAPAQKNLELEIQFRKILSNVYRYLDLAVPETLMHPLFSESSLTSEGKRSTVLTTGVSDHVGNNKLKRETGRLSTESNGNSDDKISTSPPFSKTARKNERGRKELVHWAETEENQFLMRNEKSTENQPILKMFSIETSSSAAESEWLYFFLSFKNKLESSDFVDLYVDINHRAGAGAVSLLSGKNFRVSPLDGWEFALLTRWNPSKGWECNLFRSNSSVLIYTASLKSVSDNQTEFEIKIPKKLLGEDPSRWGYLLCIFESREGALTDFMGSAESKKEMLSKLKPVQQSTAPFNGNQIIMPMMHFNSNE